MERRVWNGFLMGLALSNAEAFIEGRLQKRNILIEAGKIVQISEGKISCQKEIDCTGKIILPGAIDCHVHFRCPGFEYKEDWMSGSLAAIHGGVTTVMDMPNTRPPTNTLHEMEEKRQLAQKSAAVNFDLYMGYNAENLPEIEAACAKGLRAVKVYFGSSTQSAGQDSIENLTKLFELAKQNGFVVAVHAEDDGEIRKNTGKFEKTTASKAPDLHAKIRNDIAEAKATAKLLELQERIGNKLHIAHLSSKKGLELVKKAKKGRFGRSVTCEVTPHHLLLDSSSYKRLGNLIKCNPAIKPRKDRVALWKGLVAGDIDIIATDHAPHTLEEKKKPYRDAPSGVPGVETMMPLLLDLAFRKKIGLGRVAEACSSRPAQIFGWKSKGAIAEGLDADLIIVDPKKTSTVENARLFTKAGYSPFNGRKLKGFVEKTIVGGNVFG